MLDFCKAGNEEYRRVLYFLICVCILGTEVLNIQEAVKPEMGIRLNTSSVHAPPFCGWLFKALLIPIFINAEH